MMNNGSFGYDPIIRENMEQKETEELIEIYTLHDTSDWTPKSLEIVGEILRERGVALPTILKDQTSQEEVPLWIDDELPEEEKTFLDLSRINWSEDSIETIYQEICQHTITTSFFPEQQPGSDDALDESAMFNCVVCDAKISWEDKICPVCGLDLYPGQPFEEDLSEAANFADEMEIETIATKYRPLSTQELCDYWFESDPLDWSQVELRALRRVFNERDLIPAYLMDAPADAIMRLPYLDVQSLTLRGTPGYRNRPGRCGLDYIDTYAEAARLMGIVVHKTLSCQPVTNNIWSILILLFVGISLTSFIIPVLATDFLNIDFLPSLQLAFYFLTGVFLLLNALICIGAFLQRIVNYLSQKIESR